MLHLLLIVGSISTLTAHTIAASSRSEGLPNRQTATTTLRVGADEHYDASRIASTASVATVATAMPAGRMDLREDGAHRAKTSSIAGTFAAEEGGAVFEGGRFGDLATGGGIERHHMIADSISTFAREDGPSIQMEMADHRMTASWGNSAAARAYRAQQGAMLAEGDSAGAVQMDIMNVRGMFGTKYDDAIVQMLQRIWGGSG